MGNNLKQRHVCYVWIVASLALFVYGCIGLLGKNIPGIEQLIIWIEGVDGNLIILAGFLAILFEGLYFVGSFFPGTTLVVILSLLAHTQSPFVLVFMLLSVYMGWLLASIINIKLAHWYIKKMNFQPEKKDFLIIDHPFATWFPAFRSNQEVSQTIAGASPKEVLYSSLRVKLFGMLILIGFVLIIPLFVNIQDIENDEGFVSIFLIAFIMFTVGLLQARRTKKRTCTANS